ncbi:hypothetical protein PED39_05520 [Methanomassiliicoccales archaeon LGM-RCC1]|nr:hypothetical protein PED39_05520 [Methanomassiliicoccales archaeon LGM-RCC1]
MSTSTTNYNLTKPASGEAADISVINTNMDTIDTTMKSISDTASGKGNAELIFTSKTASSWSSDNTYPDYPYRCAIACTGVTANDVAQVTFAIDDAVSGDLAPVCQTYSGGVYIYSGSNKSITVPMILVHKG